ncbi:PspC domain-containing protein [Rathayibacter sp. VKM Ac-2759]|uniref:PspC domain-containing protein n=1 Tax=Rathayibacter sp. VKM Ac-2759 TaxID=2609252 RepID=UPI00131601C9|nr:PspC domain-containing protein [Rathayibacter sp. VKM Ac-2759]QHC65190.1 PspC domain-containing protein [Rathayibacter sp. VKM Ac-2759]
MTAASTTPPTGGRDDPGEAGPGTATTDPSSAGPSAPGPSAPGPSAPGPSAPGPSAESAPPPKENRFFLWLRALDLPRRPGWIGGVCSGIAERLGIDPLIVRGVFVVVAVLGGPAFLFYAAAWLLLPDEDDSLPVERLVRGDVDRVHAGIGVLVLASMLPVAQGFWSLGGAYTGATAWGASAGRALWTAVVVAAVIGLVLWIVRRSGRSTAPTEPPEVVPATTDRRPESVPYPERPTDARPQAPEELAAWRERQEQWKAEREAFRAQEAATARETARQRAEEARLRAAAVTAARLERQRLRRAENPRLRFSATLLALGAAALVGSLVSLTATGSTATVAGFASATLVLALAIVLAGLLRRRAVLLVAVSLVTVLTAATAALLPPDRAVLGTVGSFSLSNAAPGDYAVLAGDLQVSVSPDFDVAGGVLDVWQGAGSIQVAAMEGTAVRVESSSADPSIWITRVSGEEYLSEEPQDLRFDDGRWRWTQTFGDPDAVPFVVRIEQGGGSISVFDETGASPADEGDPGTGTTTDTTTTEPTGAAR